MIYRIEVTVHSICDRFNKKNLGFILSTKKFNIDQNILYQVKQKKNCFFFYQDILSDPLKSRGREATILYSSLSLPPAHKHSVIYLQLCMWDDYHVFLITSLDECYHLIELSCWLIDDAMSVSVYLLDDLFLNFH